jgi:hypothetical protein
MNPDIDAFFKHGTPRNAPAIQMDEEAAAAHASVDPPSNIAEESPTSEQIIEEAAAHAPVDPPSAVAEEPPASEQFVEESAGHPEHDGAATMNEEEPATDASQHIHTETIGAAQDIDAEAADMEMDDGVHVGAPSEMPMQPGEMREITVAGSASAGMDARGRTYKCFIQTTVYTRYDVRKHNYIPCLILREDMLELVHKFTPRDVYLEHCTTRPPVGKWTRVWMENFEGIEVLRGEIFLDMKTPASRRIVQKIEAAGGANLSVQVDFHAGFDREGRATQRLARIREISVVEQPDFGAAFITTAASGAGAAADFDPEMCLTLDCPLVVTDPPMENMQTEPAAPADAGADVQNDQGAQSAQPETVQQSEKAPQSDASDFDRVVQQSISRIWEVTQVADRAAQTIGEDAAQLRSMAERLSKNPSLFSDAGFMQQMESERQIVERMCEREMKRAQPKTAPAQQAQAQQGAKRPASDMRTPSPSDMERSLNKDFRNVSARLQNAGPAYTSRTGGPPPNEHVTHPIAQNQERAYTNLNDFVLALLSATPEKFNAPTVPISVPRSQHYRQMMDSTPIGVNGEMSEVVRVAGSFHVNGGVDDMYTAYMKN